MDSQIERPHDYGYEQEPHDAGLHAEDEGEHHHEKKSVMEKVKAKAKKIKDTLNLHGHGHGHDQDHLRPEGHVPDDHDLDEEDDEKMVDDPAIHDGGSAVESAAIRSSVPGQVGKLGDSETNYGRSADKKDYLDDSRAKITGSEKSFLPDEDTGLKVSVGMEQTKSVDPIESFAREQEAIRGQPEVQLEGPMDLVEDPDAPKNKPEDQIPSNYQTKVTDPTGARGEDIEVDSILGSLDKVNISEESKIPTRHLDRSISPTGSHDQYSPEPTPPIPITSQCQETSELQEHPCDETADKASKQGSYTGKISSATSAIADKAIAASNVVLSKLGYGGKDNAKEHEMHEGQDQAKPASRVEYGKKIAATVTEKFTPVYEKVAERGSTVMSKDHGIGTGNKAESNVKGQDKRVSVKDYLTEKLKPGEEDKALSEVISEALHKQKPEDEKGDKPIDKVTESEEVKRRLGSTEENSPERVDPSSVHVPGSAMVDKIKGVVGSSFGKGVENQASQQPLGSSTGTEAFSTTSASGEETGEKILQESGN